MGSSGEPLPLSPSQAKGLGAVMASLAAAFSPLVSRSSSNFLGGLSYLDRPFLSWHFLYHSVEEYSALLACGQ